MKLVALWLVLALVTPVAAAPRKVLVLPLDGDAPADLRKKLSASFARVARVLDGDVEAGNTSLVDTAMAIGCAPEQPACVESVRATLGVDELIYGVADETAGTVTVIARRYRKGKPLRELTVRHPASEPPNKIEPQLLPVFGNEPLTVAPVAPAPAPVIADAPPSHAAEPPPPAAPEAHGRNRWIAVTAGGGLITVIGLALWAQASDLQGDIDDAQPNTNGDLDALRALEDKASSRAWAGNFFVLAGLALGGYGVYRLITLPANVAIEPAPTSGGGSVSVRVRW